MALSCLIGHSWNGCKCSKCGKMRDTEHAWNGCVCSICGKARDEGHDWSKDCEKCSICGKEYLFGSFHDYSRDCEKCSVCGKERSDSHDWIGCTCSKCYKRRNTALKGHIYYKNVCIGCGESYNSDKTPSMSATRPSTLRETNLIDNALLFYRPNDHRKTNSQDLRFVYSGISKADYDGDMHQDLIQWYRESENTQIIEISDYDIDVNDFTSFFRTKLLNKESSYLVSTYVTANNDCLYILIELKADLKLPVSESDRVHIDRMITIILIGARAKQRRIENRISRNEKVSEEEKAIAANVDYPLLQASLYVMRRWDVTLEQLATYNSKFNDLMYGKTNLHR